MRMTKWHASGSRSSLAAFSCLLAQLALLALLFIRSALDIEIKRDSLVGSF